MGLNYYRRPRRTELDTDRVAFPFVSTAFGREDPDYAHVDYADEAQFYNDILDNVRTRLENINIERLRR